MADPLEGLLPLFKDYNKIQFALRQYCANAQAHRLLKFGWEPQINLYEPRLLLLLAMCMPLHTRLTIIKAAWYKAAAINDTNVLEFLARELPDFKMINKADVTAEMVPA